MNDVVRFTLVSLAMFGVAFASLYGARRWRRLRYLFRVLTFAGVVAGAYLFWYSHRPLPDAGRWKLFDGVEYVREVRREPRPMIVHVVAIDLDAPGLRFLSTPGDDIEGGEFAARTVSQFVDEYDLQLAINGDFFDPWRDFWIGDYYPHVGDPVNVRGTAIANGELVTTGYYTAADYDTLFISEDNHVSFEDGVDGAYNAISGNIMLLVDGVPVDIDGNNAYLTQRNPRTAVGLDAAGRTLLFILVDGRQPGYSEGATIADIVALMQEYGAVDALNLDGGGSVTLAMEGEDGQPIVLNSPIQSNVPGRERPVANHLGVYVARE